MAIDLIYDDPVTKGKIYQGGYREIPWDLKTAGIDLVIYAAAECPPLSQHVGAEKFSCPNDDNMAPVGHPIYQALLWNAQKGVPKVVEAVKAGKTALVTCNMGLNRSGLIIGLSLKQLTNLNADEIIKMVQTRRTNALLNRSFQAMVRSA